LSQIESNFIFTHFFRQLLYFNRKRLFKWIQS